MNRISATTAGRNLLVVGLFTAHWYDYPRTGYFAKTLGFPSAFFVAGLFMLAGAPLRPGTLVRLLLVTGGTSAVYWAEAPGLFIGLLGGAFLVARTALGGRASLLQPLQSVRWVGQHAVVLGLMGLTALLVRSYVAATPGPMARNDFIARHTVALVSPDQGPMYSLPPWSHVMLTLADLEHQAIPLSGLSPAVLYAMLLFSAACWLVLAGIAWCRRDQAAVALTGGPIALLAFLVPLTSSAAQWTTYQLPGTFYPLALCAASLLIDGTATSRRRLTERVLSGGLVLLVLASIGLRLPRFVGAVDRYAGAGVPAWLQFSQVELDGLATAVGSQTVRVDIPQPHLSYVLLIELAGRRGIDVQWEPSSWQYILGYRGWPAPESSKPAALIIQASTEPEDAGMTTVYVTRQYRLARPPEPIDAVLPVPKSTAEHRVEGHP